MLSRLFSAPRRRQAAERTFEALIQAWRNPALFGPGAFPDDPDGRFEATALYSAVLFARLAGRGEQAEELAQTVFDIQFKAFDQALRDLGVGDVHVGKRIRRMAEQFYGRLSAYRTAIDSADVAGLADAISRNLPPASGIAEGFPVTAAEAALDWSARLAALPGEALAEGRIADA
jgi:cytochrome b pre-mRNA-processing protein 3